MLDALLGSENVSIDVPVVVSVEQLLLLALKLFEASLVALGLVAESVRVVPHLSPDRLALRARQAMRRVMVLDGSLDVREHVAAIAALAAPKRLTKQSTKPARGGWQSRALRPGSPIVRRARSQASVGG